MNQPPARGRRWRPTDRTGGPLDDILDRVRRDHPQLVVERLQTTHPGDDDNVYYLGDGFGSGRVQIDTAPDGQPPFLIEDAIRRHQTADPTDAAAVITAWLLDSR